MVMIDEELDYNYKVQRDVAKYVGVSSVSV